MENGDRIAAWLAEAHLALLRGNNREVAALCGRILDAQPENGPACFLLGRAHESEGRGEEALHWVGTAVDLEPHREEWKRHLDALIRRESRRVVKTKPAPRGRASDTLVREPAAWRRNPVAWAALAAGAILSLAAGLWTGQKLYVPANSLPKPIPAKTTPTEPVVVASPQPAAAESRPAPVGPPKPEASSPRAPTQVPGADSTLFDPSTGTFQIRFLVPAEGSDNAPALAAAGETLARAALAQNPQARIIDIEAAVPLPGGDHRIVWRGRGSAPWPVAPSDPLLRPSSP
ncbi:MAG: hypothetical protein ACKO5K_06345 [Armatimonadota bacterium]